MFVDHKNLNGKCFIDLNEVRQNAAMEDMTGMTDYGEGVNNRLMESVTMHMKVVGKEILDIENEEQEEEECDDSINSDIHKAALARLSKIELDFCLLDVDKVELFFEKGCGCSKWMGKNCICHSL